MNLPVINTPEPVPVQIRDLPGRLNREGRTLKAMFALYCEKQHANPDSAHALCHICRELEEYSLARLSRCPFGENKSACSECLVHCYKPVMRERIRDVMRFSGPRMLFRHPWLAVMHLLDQKFRAPTPLPRRDG